jgi:hypothetical protein
VSGVCTLTARSVRGLREIRMRAYARTDGKQRMTAPGQTSSRVRDVDGAICVCACVCVRVWCHMYAVSQCGQCEECAKPLDRFALCGGSPLRSTRAPAKLRPFPYTRIASVPEGFGLTSPFSDARFIPQQCPSNFGLTLARLYIEPPAHYLGERINPSNGVR